MRGLTIVTGFDRDARAREFDRLAAEAVGAERRHSTCGELVDHLDAAGARGAVVEARDPFAVACAVLTGPHGMRRINGIVCVVDCAAAAVRLATGAGVAPTAAARAQLAMADVIMLSDPECVRERSLCRIRCQARDLNPRARIATSTSRGCSGDLAEIGASDPDAITRRVLATRASSVSGDVQVATVDLPGPLADEHVWHVVGALVGGRFGFVLRFEAQLAGRGGRRYRVWGIGPVLGHVVDDANAASVGRICIVGGGLQLPRLARELRELGIVTRRSDDAPEA